MPFLLRQTPNQHLFHQSTNYTLAQSSHVPAGLAQVEELEIAEHHPYMAFEVARNETPSCELYHALNGTVRSSSPSGISSTEPSNTKSTSERCMTGYPQCHTLQLVQCLESPMTNNLVIKNILIRSWLYWLLLAIRQVFFVITSGVCNYLQPLATHEPVLTNQFCHFTVNSTLVSQATLKRQKYRSPTRKNIIKCYYSWWSLCEN